MTVSIVTQTSVRPERSEDFARWQGETSTTIAAFPGFIGVAFSSILKDASASHTAFAIAAGGAMAPPSPNPFTPQGFRGDGDC